MKKLAKRGKRTEVLSISRTPPASPPKASLKKARDKLDVKENSPSKVAAKIVHVDDDATKGIVVGKLPPRPTMATTSKQQDDVLQGRGTLVSIEGDDASKGKKQELPVPSPHDALKKGYSVATKGEGVDVSKGQRIREFPPVRRSDIREGPYVGTRKGANVQEDGADKHRKQDQVLCPPPVNVNVNVPDRLCRVMKTGKEGDGESKSMNQEIMPPLPTKTGMLILRDGEKSKGKNQEIMPSSPTKTSVLSMRDGRSKSRNQEIMPPSPSEGLNRDYVTKGKEHESPPPSTSSGLHKPTAAKDTQGDDAAARDKRQEHLLPSSEYACNEIAIRDSELEIPSSCRPDNSARSKWQGFLSKAWTYAPYQQRSRLTTETNDDESWERQCYKRH